ncbi:MAG: CRP/FNR family cyclic AMP-dependent transcriptional regulator [Desulforhopalus sp.]|jgi:CRP/FNR family cyclic AMP-dependent transcriptional regulator
MQFRNGVFIITEDDHCPLYNVREELKVSDGVLLLPAAKPTCLTLAKDLVEIAQADRNYETYTKGKTEKSKFECGGCTGLIRFEYKKDKEFATVQMKLLAATERREKILGVRHFAGLLRSISMFKVLSDEDLLDLATLLELNDFPWQFPITQKGDPGDRLFVLLSGRAEVIDEHGVVFAELDRGEVFGEMSLLSGERVTTTIMASEPCQVAVMNQKNFKHVLNRFPTLQVFFYKLLVSRITKMNEQRAQELASGMVGQISDISVVELCQMVNSNQKTGRLNVETSDQRGTILFNEGELVHVEYKNLMGRDAFYELIGTETGRFKFSQGLTYKEKQLDVLGGFMGIIMEGMKRLDDRS